jgi:hypothetical protein
MEQAIETSVWLAGAIRYGRLKQAFGMAIQTSFGCCCKLIALASSRVREGGEGVGGAWGRLQLLD